MALDNLVIEKIISDLSDEVTGAFLDHPFNLSYNQFALPFHSGKNAENKGRGTIIFSLDSSNPFITYSFSKFTKVDDKSAFSNILKKVSGTKVVGVEKLAGERVVYFNLKIMNSTLDSLEDGYRLVFELFPQRPNLFLVNNNGIILAQFKEHGDILSERYMARGLKYKDLPERKILDNSFKSPDDLKQYLSRSTYKLFLDYSSQIAFNEALSNLLDSKDLYFSSKGIEPFNFGRADFQKIQVKNIFEFYCDDQKKLANEIKQRKLKELIDHQLKIAEKKLLNLNKDLSTNKSRLIYKDYGQILFLYQTECNYTDVELKKDGFAIPLNPKLDYVENANLYFKKYRKAKAAVPILINLIEQTKNDIFYLKKKLLDLANGSPRDILELKTELVMTGYLKDKVLEKRISKPTSKKHYEPHYLTSERFKIGFGMNDLQNETLTFEIASQNALFFHVKDYPGSHVLLLAGQEYEFAQELAAELALYLSNKNEGEVLMALRRDVKKNKSKKGLVNILKYTSIIIKNIRRESLDFFHKELR